MELRQNTQKTDHRLPVTEHRSTSARARLKPLSPTPAVPIRTYGCISRRRLREPIPSTPGRRLGGWKSR